MTEKSEFLPFHAINEYMRPDFRLNVIRDTLAGASKLDQHLSNDLNHQIKKYVTVPGFRSSDKAPALVKTLPTSKAFEKNPELVAATLACWSEIHADLREQVLSVLRHRHWKILSEGEGIPSTVAITDVVKEWPVVPVSMDRTRLPGFFIHWPKGEDFEAIYKSFAELYPDAQSSIDKVSLMAVWLSMRLPFQVDAELETITAVQEEGAIEEQPAPPVESRPDERE